MYQLETRFARIILCISFDIWIAFRFLLFIIFYCCTCSISRFYYTLGRYERRGLSVTLLLFIVDPSGYRDVLLLCHNTYSVRVRQLSGQSRSGGQSTMFLSVFFWIPRDYIYAG